MPFTSSGRYYAIDPFGAWGRDTGAGIFREMVGGILDRRWVFGTSTPDERVPAPVVPDVISEIPQTWEELERVHPEVFEPILETRPGQVPDPYPGTEAAGTVNPGAIIGQVYDTGTTEQQEDEVVSHDWGHWARQIGSELLGVGEQPMGVANGAVGLAPPGTGVIPGPAAAPAGGDCDGMVWGGGTPPKGYKVVNYCGRGVLRKVRRRRRRRLLTSSDSRDIATIVGLVGKGQMASALINRR